jgi:predicted transcriptional regulator
MSKQVNVRFDGAILKQLQDLADSTGKGLSDVLREAVNTSYWLHEQQKRNKKILIQGEDDKNPIQVVFR